MIKWRRLLLWLIFWLCFGLWLSSYTHYTSVGIDSDAYHADKIVYTYYRVRWTGSGSLWFGGGQSERALDSPKPFEPFDLAATFFAPAKEKPVPQTLFNRLGFWLIRNTTPSRQYWLGVPAWLPVLLVGGLLWHGRKV